MVYPFSLFIFLVDGNKVHEVVCDTVILTLLWSVWKSQNHMVFDVDLLPMSHILVLVADHPRLWIVCTLRHVDTRPLLDWRRANIEYTLPPSHVTPRAACHSYTPDEGMTCGSSILAYLVFDPRRASTEGIARPTKIAWRGPGARLDVQAKDSRRPS
jgi:hypothetical protein